MCSQSRTMLPPSTPSLLGHANMKWPCEGRRTICTLGSVVYGGCRQPFELDVTFVGGVLPALRGPRALWEVLSLLLEEGTPSHAAHC